MLILLKSLKLSLNYNAIFSLVAIYYYRPHAEISFVYSLKWSWLSPGASFYITKIHSCSTEYSASHESQLSVSALSTIEAIILYVIRKYV